jgi:hypothetical protein
MKYTTNVVKTLILILILWGGTSAKAQTFEIGGMLGGSYYFGDVNNEWGIMPSQVRYSYMAFGKLYLNPRIVLRGNIAHGRVVGIDTLAASSRWQQRRNLNFFSDITEFSGVVELNLVEDRAKGRRIKNRTVPYIFAGIGLFHFNAQTLYNGTVYNLIDFNTAGETYSQNAICYPLGAGVRRYITPNFLLGIEFGARLTSTSYLDDIPGRTSKWQDYTTITDPLKYRLTFGREITDTRRRPPGGLRGKMNGNDMYFFFGVTLSYKRNSSYVRGFQGKSISCPRFY